MRLQVPVQLRWSDMDAYGHVNNVELLRLLEEARIEAFWAHPAPAPGPTAPDRPAWPTAVLDAGPGAATATLVARQEVEYLRPLGYRRTPVVVDMWIGHLGGASIDVCYEVHDGDPAATDAAGPYARAVTTLVLVDPASGSPRRIGDVERAAWLPYVESPPVFRRRGR
ncbi:acyl-CoA thioesterase [Cellulomonas hominis]|jgi:acyl-CoA thioester hydrolase|uniref:Acyl-CoA thioester hydrolase n=1 Tax=Cellulomonas hominis TaxID=156981 RepID=A0A7W8SAF2_9CELL|nr:acyl-CoA thioesterase [Cellulomonas hominis]MBB5471460.1 acyl-CoA thioester hydrolase [Cellulomonas hominis]MBU5423796.1 acyl-CoA thioesterase [Cellulomonas hominis]NKY10292.1 acyl-CoA thioesterase [Cellulomonas hominis]